MQDSKDENWAADYSISVESEPTETSQEVDLHTAQSAEPDGWQQYRRWISKAPAPRSRRSGIDPSLYTWKGYRNWSDKVKRDWSDS